MTYIILKCIIASESEEQPHRVKKGWYYKMCKANSNMIEKVSELMELRKMAEELQSEMDAITDEIKAYMGSEVTMMAGSWKVTYKETVSRRMDTTALKRFWAMRLKGITRPLLPDPSR